MCHCWFVWLQSLSPCFAPHCIPLWTCDTWHWCSKNTLYTFHLPEALHRGISFSTNRECLCDLCVEMQWWQQAGSADSQPLPSYRLELWVPWTGTEWKQMELIIMKLRVACMLWFSSRKQSSLNVWSWLIQSPLEFFGAKAGFNLVTSDRRGWGQW